MAVHQIPIVPRPAIRLRQPFRFWPLGVGDITKPTYPDVIQLTSQAVKGATTLSIYAPGQDLLLKNAKYLNFVDRVTGRSYLVTRTTDTLAAATSMTCTPLLETIPSGASAEPIFWCFLAESWSVVPEINFAQASALPEDGFSAQIPNDYTVGGEMMFIYAGTDAVQRQLDFCSDNLLPIYYEYYKDDITEGIVGELYAGAAYVSSPAKPAEADVQKATYQLTGITRPVRTDPTTGDIISRILAIIPTNPTQGSQVTIYGCGFDGITQFNVGANLASVSAGGSPAGSFLTTNASQFRLTAPVPSGTGTRFVSLSQGTSRYIVSNQPRVTVS